MTRRHLVRLLFVVLALLTHVPAQAQTQFFTYLDLDNDSTTGCSVTTADGAFSGVERALTTVADSSEVTAVQVRICDPVSGTFGPPTPVTAPFAPPWPVGDGNGVDGANVVESYLPVESCGVVRLGFASLASGGSEDAVLTTNGMMGGDPILLSCVTGSGNVIDIPTLSFWGLFALALALTAVAYRVLRRQRRISALVVFFVCGALLATVALAYLITLDGDVSDWDSVDRLEVSDPEGDASSAADIYAAFARKDEDLIFFRFDSPLTGVPTAQDDAFATNEDSPVSGNVFADNGNGPDSDPNNDPLTVSAVNGSAGDVGNPIILLSGAQLTLNADGTFTYDPNGAFDDLAPGENETDSFSYTLSTANGTDDAMVTVTVNGVNDCPTAVDDAAATAEDAVLNGNVIVNDLDVDGDTLAVVAVNGLPSVGVQITLPSGALLTVNANGDFTYDPNGAFGDLDEGETANDSFTYTVNDGSGPACNDDATVTITINGLNEAPIAIDDQFTTDEDTVLPAGANVFAANPTTVDSDPNGDAFTVTAVNGVPGDVGMQIVLVPSGALVTVNMNGDLSFDPNGGFESLAVGETDQATFTYTISDSFGGSDTATVTVTVTGVNDCPVAVDDTGTTTDSTMLTGDVLTNDTDDEDDPLTVVAVNGSPANVGAPVLLPGGGLLTINADGTWLFNPNGAYSDLGVGDSEIESVTYTVNDGSGAACDDTATLTITINGANDCPLAIDDAVSVDENGTLNGDVLAANPTTPDSDPEGDPLTVVEVNGVPGDVGVEVTLPSGALLTVNADGTFTYNPDNSFESLDSGETATDTFTYTITDGNAACSVTATVTVTINGENDCPVAVNDTATTDEATGTSGNVVTNDTDVDVETLTVVAVNGSLANVGVPIALSGGGLVTINADGTWTFDPNGAYEDLGSGDNAVESVTYTVNDGSGAACNDDATLMITITGLNDCPTAEPDAVSVSENGTLNGNVLVANPTTPDSDPDGDTLTVVAVNGAGPVGTQITLLSGALLTVNANGTFTYDPNNSFESLDDGETTTDSFTYTINDGSGPGCNATATVTVTINGENDCPVATPDTAVTDEDTGTSGNVLTNDTDVDVETLTVVAVNGSPANVGVAILLSGGGSVTINANGTWTFNPNGAYEDLGTGATAVESVTYTVNDGSGAACNDDASLTITINGLNDCPTAIDDAVSVDENGTLNGNVLAANPTTPDSDPENNTLTVVAVNGVPANVGVQFALASGALLTVNADGTFTYNPNNSFESLDSGETGNDTFTYTINDGSGPGCNATATVTVTINGENDCPVAINDVAATDEATGTSGNVLTNDTDVDVETLSVVAVNGSPANVGVAIALTGGGLVTVNADGTWAFDPNGAYEDLGTGDTAVESVTYTVNDGSGAACNDDATLTITINGLNDCPTAVADAVSVTENGTLNGNVLVANPTTPDSDPDGDPLSVVAVNGVPANVGVQITLPSGALLTVNANGTFTYNPNNSFESLDSGETGGDSFTYTINDGSGPGCNATATVTVTINGENDCPVAFDDAASTDEDTGTGGNVVTNDMDVDVETLTVVAVNGSPANVGVAIVLSGGGLLTINADGTWAFNPNGAYDALRMGETAVESVTYTVNDGSGVACNDDATLMITITGVNDPLICTVDPVAYAAPGNTQLRAGSFAGPDASRAFVTDAQDLITKAAPADPDSAGPFTTVAATDQATTQGGSVDIDTTGSFVYRPPVGFTGADSFTFMVSDPDGGAVNCTANLTVAPRVWYVQVAEFGAAGGTGHSIDPFRTLSAAETASGVNDIIFMFADGTEVTPHDDDILLKNGQRFWGEGVGLTLAGFTPSPIVAAGTAPRITSSTTTSVRVNANAADQLGVEIRGLELASTSGDAIDVTATGGFDADVEVSDNVIAGASVRGIDINGNTAAGLVSALIENNTVHATGRAVSVTTTAGNLNLAFNDNTDIVSMADNGVVIDGSGGGVLRIVDFQDNAVSGNTAGSGVVISTASFDADPGTVATNTVTGGSLTVGGGGNGVGMSGVVLTGVQGRVDFTSLAIDADGGVGLSGLSTGTLNVPAGTGFHLGIGSGTIDGRNGSGTGGAVNLELMGATITADALSSGSPSTGIRLVNVSGTVNFDALSNVAGGAGTAFLVSGGAPTVTYSGALSQGTNNRIVDINTVNAGSVTFTASSTVNATAGTGVRIANNVGATPIQFNGSVDLGTNVGRLAADALTMTGNSAGTAVSFANLDIFTMNATNDGIVATGSGSLGITTGRVDATGNGFALDVDGITFTPTLTDLNAANTTTGGVDLTNTPGAKTFQSVNVTTTTGAAFNASNAGTVTVTGAGNTLSSTTGTALSVVNTTIGASGLTFQSISSNGGTNSGIIMDSTGLTGGLLVTGNGTAASGGTIANKSGSNGSTSTGVGIYLNNTSNASFSRMQLNDFENFAIRGNGVSGFTLTNSVINALDGSPLNGTTQGEGGVGEGSIRFDNLTGIAIISNSTITHGIYDNVGIFNTNTATLNLTVSNSFFATTTVANTGNDAFRIEIDDTVAGAPQTQANIIFETCTFTSARGDLLDVIGQRAGVASINAAIVDVNIAHNDFSNNHSTIASGGGGVIIHGNGNLTFNIEDNDLRDARGRALNISKGALFGQFAGAINNNRIGVAGVSFSGSDESSGIYVDGGGAFPGGGARGMTISITNNQVRRTNEAGIFLVANNQAISGNNGNIHATISGNFVAEPESALSFAGLWVDIGTGVSGDTTAACVDIGGGGLLSNDFSVGDPFNAGDINLAVQSGSTMRFPGYGGANNNDGQITTYLTSRNSNPGSTAVSLSHTGTMMSNPGACAQ